MSQHDETRAGNAADPDRSENPDTARAGADPAPPDKADAFEGLLGIFEAKFDASELPTLEGGSSVSGRPGNAGIAGDIIDRYTLLELIGEGGMGVVWQARQSQPVEREVALKVIKLGMDTKQVVARFEAERQTLALMDHPNIAKVLDGGATQAGRPYFVMELVRGTPITEYCDTAKMDTRARLDLFRKVCAAIGHAHQKGMLPV